MKNKTNMENWKIALENLPKSYKEWFKGEKGYLVKNIKENSSVLDIGCGDGRVMKYLIEVTSNLTGIDHDEKAIEFTKNSFKDRPEIKILIANATNLPFKDNSFDYVICIGTFANFAEKKHRVLREMRRVLKKSGKMLISTYSEDALAERMKLYKGVFHMVEGSEIKEVKDDGTVIFRKSRRVEDNTSEQFSKEQLTSIFNKADLEVEEIKKFGIGYVCKLRKKTQ